MTKLPDPKFAPSNFPEAYPRLKETIEAKFEELEVRVLDLEQQVKRLEKNLTAYPF